MKTVLQNIHSRKSFEIGCMYKKERNDEFTENFIPYLKVYLLALSTKIALCSLLDDLAIFSGLVVFYKSRFGEEVGVSVPLVYSTNTHCKLQF